MRKIGRRQVRELTTIASVTRQLIRHAANVDRALELAELATEVQPHAVDRWLPWRSLAPAQLDAAEAGEDFIRGTVSVRRRQLFELRFVGRDRRQPSNRRRAP